MVNPHFVPSNQMTTKQFFVTCVWTSSSWDGATRWCRSRALRFCETQQADTCNTWNTETHNRLTAFVWDNPGRPVPEETLTHSHPTWSSDILFIIFLHLQRSMASSLFILRAWQTSQTTSLQVLFGSSWSSTLNFILHTFLHPIIIFLQHIPTQPVLLQNQCYVTYT